MPLNPVLYQALRDTFGSVKVSNDNVPFRYVVETDAVTRRQRIHQTQGGEQYSVCCPLCGDRRHRLVIGHSWLSAPEKTLPMLTHNAKCYNENCAVTAEAFWMPIYDLTQGMVARGMLFNPPPAPAKPIEHKLPIGLVPLDQLPSDHQAIRFLQSKYKDLSPAYLAYGYGASYASLYDESARLAQGRIIFPVYERGILAGWQGRATNPKDTRRWILSTGFRKVFYNGDRIDGGAIPIIAEGITSSIACGPYGTALFGKELDERRCQEFAQRWKTAIIALDPETYVPDIREGGEGRIFAEELQQKLARYCKLPPVLLRWPNEYLDLAKRKFESEAAAKRLKQELPSDQRISVPDPADIGMRGMAELLATIPATHRNWL